jgi:hypothetical protein
MGNGRCLQVKGIDATMKKYSLPVMLMLCGALLCGGAGFARAQGDEGGGPSSARVQGEEVGGASDMVSCVEGMLKIEAPNVKPEDLIRDIGDKCGIKVVVFGEAFDDKPIGVKFQQMPVRRGLQRVLRIANMPNFVLHFDNNTANPRIVELDIMGKKGGERQLTSGTGRSASPGTVPPPATPPASAPPASAPEKPAVLDKRDAKKPPVIEPKDIPKDVVLDKKQEDFMKVMDEMMKAQEMGEEPDPAEVLRIFKEVVPPEIREQIPPDVLKEIEDFEKNRPPVQPRAPGGATKK